MTGELDRHNAHLVAVCSSCGMWPPHRCVPRSESSRAQRWDATPLAECHVARLRAADRGLGDDLRHPAVCVGRKKPIEMRVNVEIGGVPIGSVPMFEQWTSYRHDFVDGVCENCGAER